MVRTPYNQVGHVSKVAHRGLSIRAGYRLARADIAQVVISVEGERPREIRAAWFCYSEGVTAKQQAVILM